MQGGISIANQCSGSYEFCKMSGSFLWLIVTKLQNIRGYVSFHYNDVIMGAMASQITSLTIVYSTVYSGADKKTIKAPRHWSLCGEFTGHRWIRRINIQ